LSTLFLGRGGSVGTEVVVPALAGCALAPPPLDEDTRAMLQRLAPR